MAASARLPRVPIESLSELLSTIKPPLGPRNLYRMEHEMIPRLLKWMEGQVDMGVIRVTLKSPSIPVQELLRFLIVFGYDVDVRPPRKNWRAALARSRGKRQVINQQHWKGAVDKILLVKTLPPLRGVADTLKALPATSSLSLEVSSPSASPPIPKRLRSVRLRIVPHSPSEDRSGEQ